MILHFPQGLEKPRFDIWKYTTHFSHIVDSFHFYQESKVGKRVHFCVVVKYTRLQTRKVWVLVLPWVQIPTDQLWANHSLLILGKKARTNHFWKPCQENCKDFSSQPPNIRTKGCMSTVSFTEICGKKWKNST